MSKRQKEEKNLMKKQ